MRRLLLPAVLVYSVILFRAGHQAVTLDEADAYINFSTGNLDMSFYPSSGNHVLNSLLARYATQLFGLSQFTFRIPAMIGAAIYLLAAASIATRIAVANKMVQFLGFAILTLNPFVLDYLIASRGYALALGLLAAALALMLPWSAHLADWRRHVLLSTCCGLALAANFSFAFAILSMVAAYLIALLLNKTPLRQWMVIAACTIIPGVLAAGALVGATLKNYPRQQLYYGADTWTQTFTEMADAVFPRGNLSFQVFTPVLVAVHPAAAYLILVPIVIAAWVAITNREEHEQDRLAAGGQVAVVPGLSGAAGSGLYASSWPVRFVWLALIFTMGAHTLAHLVNNLLLPLDRTGLFLTLFFSVLAIYAAATAPMAKARFVAAMALCVALVVFGLSFRTNYFRIWDFDLDIDRGFAALDQYSKNHPVQSVGATWRYGGAYNFYKRATPTVSLPQCDYIDQDQPPPRSAYFLNVPGQAGFITRQKLEIIYQGPISGLVVGVAPAQKSE